MTTALQNFTTMGAIHGFSVVTSGKFAPSNTGLTALLQGFAMVDPAAPTVALGTAAAPVVVSGSTAAPASATGTVSSVASGIASVTILAANANRLGATILNTDANALYLLLNSGTASATNLTVNVPANGYYEVPFRYTGILKGIWAADGSGSAIVTEFTA